MYIDYCHGKIVPCEIGLKLIQNDRSLDRAVIMRVPGGSEISVMLNTVLKFYISAESDKNNKWSLKLFSQRNSIPSKEPVSLAALFLDKTSIYNWCYSMILRP